MSRPGRLRVSAKTKANPLVGCVMLRYRFDAEHSRFTVQAFVTGLLSFAGHSPTFAARSFNGHLQWQPDPSQGGELQLIVRADSLQLIDSVRPADREEIEVRMKREVLEAARYPEIRVESNEVMTKGLSDKKYRVQIVGELTLHGVTNREVIEADVRVFDDGIRLAGEFPLRMSHYRIAPVTVLGGTIRLKDQLRVAFDIAAMKEKQ